MDKRDGKKKNVWIKTAAAVLFWLAVWQLAAMYMNNNILAASPAETVKTLWELVQTAAFWKAVASSFAKIASGFFLAVLAGIVCAVLASVSELVRALLNPLLRLIKAVPVASFIILALLWISSKNLSVLISFLMVLPVIYTNVLQGIEATDRELLEMAEVFRITKGKRLRYIYLPAVLPYFVSACSVGLGFCFKSGIAAEIIGLPQNSIGERLYEAKLYLMTGELFAWTAVIVAVSVLFEKAVMLLVRTVAKGLTGTLREAGPSEQEEESGAEQGEPATRKETAGPGDFLNRSASGEQGKAAEAKRQERSGKLPLQADGEERTEELPAGEAQKCFGLFGATKRFEDKTVLERFTIRIRPGETVALMGASGCGKSTAGKLLLGLAEADEGTVKRPKRIGAVFQENRLCKEFDAVTNIAMVTGNRRQAEEALCAVGLSGIKGRPAAALSGGMKQRVAVLRALLSDAELLVLDEPFTGLDAARKESLQQYVKENLKGRSVLFITHNAEEAAFLADRTVFLE